MKHLEVHIIESIHDFELANLSGLLDDDVALYDTICEICEQLVYSDGDARNAKLPVYVTLSDEACVISCDSCLVEGIEKTRLDNND